MKNKLNLKNCITVFKYDFKFTLKSFLIWLAALTGITLLYMALFPMIKEIMQDSFNSLPPELGGAFAGEGMNDMMNYSNYFGMIYKMILTVLGAYAMITTASLLHDEELRGSIDFLVSHNLTRSEIIVSKLAHCAFKLFILQFVVITISLIVGSLINDDTFSAKAVSNAGIISLFVLITYMSLGYLVGVLTPKKNKTVSIALGVFFLLFILGYLSALNVKALEFFKYLNPVDMLDPTAVINSKLGITSSSYNFFPLILSIIVSIAAIIGGTIYYHKKDL